MNKIIRFVVSTAVILIFILGIYSAVTFISSNYDILNFDHNIDVANVRLQNGDIVSGEVDSWKYIDNEQLMIEIDGVVYRVHSSNVDMFRVTDAKRKELQTKQSEKGLDNTENESIRH